jgi:ankyrin repeat protein
MLKNKTININRCDSYGINAFWIASFYGHTEAMRLLIANGADIFARNHNGSNALHIAVKKNNFSIVKALLNMKFPQN